MEEKMTIFDYFSQVFTCFGLTMILMMCIIYAVGDSAQGYSSFFIFGNQGIPLNVMVEYLFLSGIIIFLKYLFFASNLIKSWGILKRSVVMITLVCIVVVIFILTFDWFPVKEWLPWLLFLLSFVVSASASVLTCIIRTKLENKRLEEGLTKMKAELYEQTGHKQKKENVERSRIIRTKNRL